MRSRDAARFLRAFGDGTRLRIILLLSRHEMTGDDLARTLRCPSKRVWRHLQYLTARGVAESEPRGRRVIYRLSPPGHDLHQAVLGCVQACRGTLEEARGDEAHVAGRGERGR